MHINLASEEGWLQVERTYQNRGGICRVTRAATTGGRCFRPIYLSSLKSTHTHIHTHTREDPLCLFLCVIQGSQQPQTDPQGTLPRGSPW